MTLPHQLGSLKVHRHHDQADDNQRHNGDYFDHRKPELHLTEHFPRPG